MEPHLHQGSDVLRLETVYTEMRREMFPISEQIWRLRTWATTLTATVALALVGANFYGRLATGRDPALFSGLILLVGALANFTLWHLNLLRDRGTIRVACYVWWLEHIGKRDSGWEHWVFYRNEEFPGTAIDSIASEVQAWLAASYVAILLYFCWMAESYRWLLGLFSLVAVLLLVIGATRRSRGHDARRRFLKELLEQTEEDWHKIVKARVLGTVDGSTDVPT